MRKIITILLVFIAVAASAQTYTYSNGYVLQSGHQDSVSMIKYSWGAWAAPGGWIYLPKSYDSTQHKRYATIMFYHGAGSNGSIGGPIADQGLAHMIANGIIPYSSTNPGDTTWFIVYSVANDYMGTTNSLPQIALDYRTLIDYYRLKIDTTRIYATGLSAGGNQSLYALWKDSSEFAASVPMSTVWTQAPQDSINKYGGWLWQLHGINDVTAPFNGASSAIQSFNALWPNKKAILFAYTGSHDSWETFYNPTWKWTSANNPNPTQDVGVFNNMSVYDWMLTHVKTWIPQNAPGLDPPIVHAGSDQSWAIGTTSAVLSGSATTTNGNIVSYTWTQAAGNTVTITSPNSPSTVISGLVNGGNYTFRLTAKDDSLQTGTDEVSIAVASPVIPDTPSYQIPISNSSSFWNGDTIFYQINDLTASGIVNTLFDEQDSANPQTEFTSGFAAKPYYPAQIVLDLGGLYKITQMQWYDKFGTDTLCIDGGSPYKWDSIAHVWENAAGIWKNINDTFYTRYLHIYYANKGNQHVRELKLFGHIVNDSLPRTHAAFPNYVTGNTMHDFIGVNVYGPTPPQIRDVAGTYRKYTNQSYIDPSSPAGIPLDSVKFDYTSVYKTGSGPYLYYYFPNGVQSNDTLALWNAGDGYADFPYLDSLGITQFWSTQGAPKYAIDSGWKKSIDYTKFPEATGDTAFQYGRMSRMAWVLGAVYGKNRYPLDSVQKISGSDTTVGAGVMKYIEMGNENNGSWLTEPTYYDPRQAVAYGSAYYDGAESTMGSRMGIKNADSTIQVLFWGDANSDHLGYLKGMAYWSYYTIGDHKIPFDIYNIHHYNNNSPETFAGVGMAKFFGDIVDTARIYCHDCPVWLSEWGYDRNHHSNIPVAYINGQDSAQTQAYWIARGWLELSFTGLDRAQLFQIQNDPLQTLYDTLGYVTYNTTGLSDGHQDPTTYRFSYYAFPAYYFQHTIWTKLSNYKPDSIIYQNNDSLYAYMYRNVNSPDSVAYAIWSGTQTNRILNNYVLRTGHSSTPIKQITLADKYMDGVGLATSTDANGNLPITITESPKLYFTTVSSIGGTLADSVSSQKNAGPTLNISPQTTSKDTTILQATATPGNSPVISYKWTQLSGPAIKFSLPSQNQSNAQVANIATDVIYTFKVTAMDANGLTDSKTVTLTAGNGGGTAIPSETKPRALLYIINGKIVLINN